MKQIKHSLSWLEVKRLMKITTLQDNLARALRVVRRAVASRATLPITQNILISAEDARVRVAATNLELSITTWLGAQVHQTGAITLPARPLLDIVSTFDDGRVELEVTDNPYGALIETNSELASGDFATRKATLHGAPVDDFPPFPEVDGDKSIRVDAGVLRNALDRVVYAAAADDARPVLTGVKMEVEEDKATFAAADGFRLSVEVAELRESVPEPFEALIPARTMNEVMGLLAGSNGTVQISVGEDAKVARFRIADEVEVITQLISGTYPDFRSLIPDSSDTSVDISVDGVDKLARTAQVIAREGSSILRILANKDDEEAEGRSKGVLNVRANSDEVGNIDGEIPVNIEGADGKIAFNVRFVSDLVGHASGGKSQMDRPRGEDDDDPVPSTIIMQISSPSSPAVFRLSDHPGFTHVVMPMYVQW